MWEKVWKIYIKWNNNENWNSVIYEMKQEAAM